MLLAALVFPVLAATGTLQVRVLDSDRATVTPARVNVIGSDNLFYEPDPARNPLSGYSLKRKGNRANVTPLRYFGSFFYTTGTFEINLPPGVARIEVSKGYSYYQVLTEVKIQPGKTSTADIVMQRVVDMPRNGWHSTDTHLHFDRAEAAADGPILQLLAAEDVELGHILTLKSAKGFGMRSLNSQGRYSIISGREATSPGLGHVNMLMINELPSAVESSPSPPSTLPLAELYDQIVKAGGMMQHDHAGYGQEIWTDVVLGKSDAVELLQFALYRPQIGPEGYYLLLNSGFRYPMLGGSDYPVCRAMSDSRTYVADVSATSPATSPATSFPTSVGRLIRGESFATSGPLLFLSVNDKGPGNQLLMPANSQQEITVDVKVISGDLPVNSIEILQDGKVAAEWHGPEPLYEKELKTTLNLNASSWIAARCSGPNTANAHTNPVWIYFGGLAPFHPEAVRQLKARVHALQDAEVSNIAKDVATDAEDKLDELLKQVPLGSNGPTRFPVTPSTATLLPVSLPRPKRLAPATIKGVVVDKSGRPLADVGVSVRGAVPAVNSNAKGQFVLHDVDANSPLFLRFIKPGYATTNTSYLNPRDLKLQVELIPFSEVAELAGRAMIRVGTSVSYRKIDLQPAWPPQTNDYEPNVIVSAGGPGKDIVFPVFAGQVSYALAAGL